jgi:hypothetical protein
VADHISLSPRETAARCSLRFSMPLVAVKHKKGEPHDHSGSFAMRNSGFSLGAAPHLPWLLGCGAFDCAVSSRFVGARSFGFAQG